MREASNIAIEKYIEEGGRRAKNTLSLLGKLLPFVQAINSELGQELLKDDIDRHEDLLVKMYEENITPQELAEFRYLKMRLKKVSMRVAEYNKGLNEVTSKSKK